MRYINNAVRVPISVQMGGFMSPKFPNLQFFGVITISNELHDPNVKVRMLVSALFLDPNENTGCSDRCSKLQSIVSMTKQNNYENDK